MITKSLKLVSTKDGEEIAVWKIFESSDFDSSESSHTANSFTVKRQNILLTHGTFSDKKTCLRIAEYLAKLGHHCYIMEWRGHGHSPIPTDKFNFETIATYDFDATLHYLFEELKLDNLHCVTHSGGGACLTMHLIQKLITQNRNDSTKLNSITMFACQTYGAVVSRKNYVKILTTKIFNRLLGYIPAKTLKLGSVNESYHTMNQWYNWNLNKNFRSMLTNLDTHHNGRLDYRQHMHNIVTPIYSISAKGDNLISPTAGCRLFFDDFNNPANVFREFSKDHGHLEDYTHSRIMTSRNAAKEVWPTVAAWIEKHAS